MKGQASVELLVILSVILVVFGTVYLIAQQEYQSSQMSLDVVKARNALKSMRDTAEYVYSQGDGASSRIYVTIPNRIEYGEVSGNYLKYRLNLGGSIQDVFEPSRACVTGYIPSDPGGQWVTLTSQGGCVRFGEATLHVSPERLSFRLYAGEVRQGLVELTNYGNESVNVSVSASGSGLVDATPHDAVVPPYGSLNITVTVTTTQSTAKGYQYAQVVVANSDKNWVDVTVLVLQNTSLSLHPDSWTPSLSRGEVRGQDFVACNNGESALSNIVLSAAGVFSGWIAYPEGATIPSLGSGECATREVLVTVPAEASVGLYAGTITADAGGVGDVSDVEVNVVEGGLNVSDIAILPREWNITLWRGASANNTYTICNLGSRVFSDVVIATSGAGDWVNFSLGRVIVFLGSGECVNNVGVLTVPIAQSHGLYSGNITVSGGNSTSNSVVLVSVFQVLNVTISNVTRCVGPTYGTFNINTLTRCIGG